MRAFFWIIVIKEILAKVQADIIGMCIKPDGEYVWILHCKDYFLEFRMLYALTSKRALEIIFYINLCIGHLEVPSILQCNNKKKFRTALLLFLKKYTKI